MPLDVPEINRRLDILLKTRRENEEQINMLIFVRDKISSGTPDELKLIKILSLLTIDNINALIKDIHESIKNAL